jgi:hypothetical protein
MDGLSRVHLDDADNRTNICKQSQKPLLRYSISLLGTQECANSYISILISL